MTLSAFIAHVARATVELDHYEHRAMEQAARIVERRAKAIVGHYQTDTGPFPAWAELADATKAERLALGYTENDPGLRSGGQRDSIGHKVGYREAAIGSNDEHLVYFELGTERQPPRSVLGAAAHQTEKQVAEIVGSGVVRALVGDEVVDRFLAIPSAEKLIP